MATSDSLNPTNPRKLSISIVVLSTLLLILGSFAVFLFSIKENHNLVKYEFKIILKGNGKLLSLGLQRDFVDQIALADHEFYVEIINSLNHLKFDSGNSSLLFGGQCETERYLEYDLKFCRPIPIPWNLIAIIFGLYFVLALASLLLLKKLSRQLVFSFESLFKVAQIPHPPSMRFDHVWEIALGMAERFQTFQAERVDLEKLKATSELARQVAHDIRSPLTALNMVSSSIADQEDPKSSLIKHSVRRINDIANDLLIKSKQNFDDTSKHRRRIQLPESEKESIPLDVPELNLSALIENIVLEKKQLPIFSKLEFKISAPQRLNVNLQSSEHLERVISNILNNSAEAMNDGLGEISILLTEVQEFIEIEIVDNGKGIEASDLQRVGSQGFSKGKGDTDSGHGLGLHHAKKYIGSIGGSLDFKSTLGEGTTVLIRIPKARRALVSD